MNSGSISVSPSHENIIMVYQSYPSAPTSMADTEEEGAVVQAAPSAQLAPLSSFFVIQRGFSSLILAWFVFQQAGLLILLVRGFDKATLTSCSSS